MRLVSDIVPQLHSETRTKETAIGHRCCGVPDLDNVDVPLRREGDSGHDFVVTLEELVGQAVDHAVDEDSVGLRGVDLLAPGAALVILGRIPERADSVPHQEEHA